MKRILLVAPGDEASQKIQSSFRIYQSPLIKKKAFTTPLHIATIAALTPPGFEVDIWDENVKGFIDEHRQFEKSYDLVGVTGYGIHFQRAVGIARVFRNRGILVVAGGAGVSSTPEVYRPHFDVLFLGESENLWPEFINDYTRGSHRSEYRSCEPPDFALSPAPRWDSIAEHLSADYMTGGVQITRGCPFSCEFCDVWKVFGRKMRAKPVAQVLEEISTLERLGVRYVLLCSDNFVGDPRYAKELLRALIPHNQTFDEPLQFTTELTLTVARDEELLELAADANFGGFLFGLESPNTESLKETRKNHNLGHGGLSENCRKVMSYGIPIDGSLIVGFDHDGLDIFDLQFEFIERTCITFPRVHMLKAIRGTDLYTRLVREGRVLEMDAVLGNTMGVDPQHTSNIIPMGMTRAQLMLGYIRLVERILDWRSFEKRITGFVANVKRQPRVRPFSPAFLDHFRSALPQMGEEAQETVERVLEFTGKTAPFLLHRVGILAIRHYQEVTRLPYLQHCIRAQVELANDISESQIAVAK